MAPLRTPGITSLRAGKRILAACAASVLLAVSLPAGAATAVTPLVVSLAGPASASAVLPGSTFSLTATTTVTPGATLRRVAFSASGCTVVTPVGTSLTGSVACPASATSSKVAVAVTDSAGAVGSASITVPFATTAPALDALSARTEAACSTTIEMTANLAASGSPIMGVPVKFEVKPPAGTSYTPLVLTGTSDKNGKASVRTTPRAGWTAQVTASAVGPYAAVTLPSLAADADSCSAAIDVTSSVPSRVAYGDTITLAGTVTALRADGQESPLRQATVTIKQTTTGTSGDTTRTLASTLAKTDGTWTIPVRLTSTGALSAEVTTTASGIAPATMAVDIGSVAVAQYMTDIVATATPVSAPLQAGGLVLVKGSLAAVHPVTGEPAGTVLRNNKVQVYFTTVGSSGSRLVGTLTTTTTGTFQGNVPVPSNGTLTLRLAPAVMALVAAPVALDQSVLAKVRLSGVPTSGIAGARVGSSVSLSPSKRGAAITMQYRVSGAASWTTLAAATTGMTSFRLPADPGIYEIRAWFDGDTRAGAAGSAPLVTTVKAGLVPESPADLDCMSTAGALPVCSWTDGTVTSPTGYRVYFGTTQVGESSTRTLSVPALYAKTGVVYTATVKALKSGSLTAASAPDSVVVLATPTNLRQTVKAATTGTVEWAKVIGATAYEVSVNGALVDTVSETTYTLSSLEPGSSRTVSVVAVSDGGDTSASASTAVTTDTLAAGSPPGNLSCVSSSAGTATCTWVAVPRALGYRVYRAGTAVTSGIAAEYPYPAPTNGVVRSTGATLSGLTAGETVTLTVTAVAGSVESLYSNAVSVKVAAPTTRLATPVPSVTAVTGTGATLAWDPVPNATGYVVNVSGIGSTTVTGTTATVSGLTSGAVHTVTVTATGGAGFSNSYAPTLRVRADAAQGVLSLACTSPSAGAARCTWAAVPGAIGYLVSKDGAALTSGVSPDSYWPAASSGVVRSTGASVSGLTAGTTVSLAVIPVFASGQGTASTPVSLVVTSPAPPALSAPVPYVSAATGTSVTVSWAPVSGAESYTVTLNGVAAGTTAEPAKTFTGLVAGVTHTVAVTATGTNSSPSVAASLRVRPDAASAPSQVSCTSPSIGTMRCQYTAALAASGYRIAVNGTALTSGVSAASPFPAASSGTVRSTTATASGLTPGAVLTVTIIAVSDAGTSTSDPVTVSIVGTPLGAPVPYVTATTASTVSLSWDAVSGATSYEVRVDSGATIPVSGTSLTLEGLTTGTTYTVRVKAKGAGYSDSPEASLKVSPGAGSL